MAKKPSSHIALLRGINVGGKHKLPMKDLVGLFEETGASDVRTYIQSGNVVFRAPASVAKGIPSRVAAAIEERFGFSSPVVLRSAKELEAAAADNPFLELADDDKSLQVAFLETRPKAAAVKGLDPHRSPGDRFEVRGRDVYLYLPRGVARTKLTNAWLDRELETTSTVRNWRTVHKLLELSRD
jgi:uncharacterized protein (DUF1697 family)